MSDINTATMLQVGTVLHGTYRIESYLSSGGFGNTYIAKNIEFGETYAIKEFFVKGVCQRDGNSTTISVSNTENSDSFAQQKEKFKKEARRLRSLSNPHIVKVYDLFEENGTAYYVMDYVDGENLSTRLNHTHLPLPESEVRNYLSQILDGLEAIHAAGIWHLDIKPANIMVDSHNVVKLIDFGASKQQSTAGGATMSTGISYTNGYAPSEQMAQSYDKFGPWTDFYALGATLYKLLTNQNPPSVTDLSEDESEDKHIALPMPNVSDEMKKLVVWMMQVNRLKRPKNVGEIRNLLKNAVVSMDSNNATQEKVANAVKSDNEATVWLDNKIDVQSKKSDQNRNQEEQERESSSKSKMHFVVISLLVFIVACGIVFFSLGSLNSTSSVESEITSANQKVIKVDGVSVYHLDSTQKHGWVGIDGYNGCVNVNFNNRHYMYCGNVFIQDGKLYPFNKEMGGNIAGSVEQCEMTIMGKKGKYTGLVAWVNGEFCAEGGGYIDFYDGGSCSASFSRGKIEYAEGVDYYYPNGDWFSGTIKNDDFVKGSLKIKKNGNLFIGTFSPSGKPLNGKWYYFK